MIEEEQEPVTDAKLDTPAAAQPAAHLDKIDLDHDNRLEEEYRLKVGTRLSEIHPNAARSLFHTTKGRIGLAAGTAIVVLAIILFAARRGDAPPPVSDSVVKVNTRYAPQRQDVVTGKVAIKAGGLAQYPITIQPEMYEAELKGHFEVDGGGDIIAILAEETDYQNWINNRPAQFLWGSESHRTSGTFDIALRPGHYHLVFSNKFSARSDKTISGEAVLNFKRQETY